MDEFVKGSWVNVEFRVRTKKVESESFTKKIEEIVIADSGSTILHFTDGTWSYTSLCEAWQPQENDYCWFYDDEKLYPLTFGKYLGIEHNLFKCAVGFSNKIVHFEYVEPFIGNIPQGNVNVKK